MDGLVDVVRKAEELYNRYRAPEAVARVLKIDGDRVVVRFTGSFHYSCGLYDWLEDMKYVLEDLYLVRRIPMDIININVQLAGPVKDCFVFLTRNYPDQNPGAHKIADSAAVLYVKR